MHELSIAMSIVDMATEEVERRGATHISAVHLKLGRLSGVAREALQFSYGLTCEGTPLEGSELIIEDVPVVVYCEVCQAERTLASEQRFCCSVCEAPTSQVVHGRELEVVALEIQT